MAASGTSELETASKELSQLAIDLELQPDVLQFFKSEGAKRSLENFLTESVVPQAGLKKFVVRLAVKVVVKVFEGMLYRFGGYGADALARHLTPKIVELAGRDDNQVGLVGGIVRLMRSALTEPAKKHELIQALRSGGEIESIIPPDQAAAKLSQDLTITLYQLSMAQQSLVKMDQLLQTVQPAQGLRLQSTKSDFFNVLPDALSYVAQATKFVGRDDSLTHLWSFVEESEALSWHVVWGPPGIGKRRLAQEFCIHALQEGWLAGFLESDLDKFDWANWRPLGNTIFVIDMQRPSLAIALRTALLQLSSRIGHLPSGIRVRFLLLAVKSDGDWREGLLPVGEPEQPLIRALQWEEPYELRGLEATYQNGLMIEMFLHQSGDLDWLERRTNSLERFLLRSGAMDRPLLAMFAGVMLAQESRERSREIVGTQSRRITRDELIESVLAPLRRRWESSAKQDIRRFLDLLMWATIADGIEVRHLTAAELTIPKYTDILGVAGNNTAPPLEPELLGEHFVLNELVGRSDAEVATLMSKCWRANGEATRTFFERVLLDFADHPSVQRGIENSLSVEGADQLSWLKFRLDLLKRWPDQGIYFELRRQAWIAFDRGMPVDGKLATRLLSRAPDYRSALTAFRQLVDLGLAPETIHYNQLIWHAKAWQVPEILREMDARSVPKNEYTYAGLVRKSSPDKVIAVLDAMCEAGLLPSARICEIAVPLVPKTEVELIFDRILGGYQCRMTHQLVDKMLMRLEPTRLGAAIWRIEENGLRVRQSQYVALLGRSDMDYKTGRSLFLGLRNSERRPSAHLYTKLLQLAPDAQVISVLEDYVKDGWPIDVVVFTVLADGAKDFHSAMRWHEKLIEANLHPDEHFYSAVLAKAVNYDNVTTVVSAMQLHGVIPNKYHYSAILRLTPYERLEAELDSMRRAGISPDRMIYNDIFSRREKDGPSFHRKRELFNEMIGEEIAPNELTILRLVESATDSRSARDILDIGAELGVPRTGRMDAALVRLSPDFKSANEIVKEIEEERGPTQEALEALLRYATRVRESFGVARTILERMMQEGFTPSVVSMEYLVELASVDEAIWLLEKMQDRGLEPTQKFLTRAKDISARKKGKGGGRLSAILQAVGLQSDKYTVANEMRVASYDEAVQLFREARGSGVSIDARMTEILMDKSTSYDLARSHMREAMEAGVSSTAWMYAALLDRCPDEKVSDVWEELASAKIPLNGRVHAAYIRRLDYQRGESHYKNLIEIGGDVDRNIFLALIEKAPAELQQTHVDAMSARGIVPDARAYEVLLETSSDFVSALTHFQSMLSNKIRPSPKCIASLANHVRRPWQMRDLVDSLLHEQIRISERTMHYLNRKARRICNTEHASLVISNLMRLTDQEPPSVGLS